MIDLLTLGMWLSIASILYAYLGYPVLLTLIAGAHQAIGDWRYSGQGGDRRRAQADLVPSVGILCAAYNEEAHIVSRVENLLASDFAADRLRIYIGSDGSDDRTAQLMVRFADNPQVRFLDFEERRGKPSVLNDLAAACNEDILVFTDANTIFEPQAIARLLRHFDDPRIGCVCGELRLVAPNGSDNPDHLYWRLERFLKFGESRIGALLGANGGIYAIRRSDYSPIPRDAIVDDFWISMNVVRAGRRCVYDPEVIAFEETPPALTDEFRRRVRIGAGNYHALFQFRQLLHPSRGLIAFTFFSHKVLRWLVPHMMIAALATNAALALGGDWRWLLMLQIAFYGTAAAGLLAARQGRVPLALRIPSFLAAMNLALLIGFVRYLGGQRTGIWSRSRR